jgi:uncharacterized membrane protein YhaH (DUF805 family)
VSFATAVRSVLRQYATFQGRATRPEFWWWYLFTFVVNIVGSGVDQLTDATIGVSFVGAVVSLGLLVPTLAVSVRRLHDSDLSGWWLLAPICLGLVGLGLFLAGLAAIIVPAFVDGAPGLRWLTIAFFAAGALILLGSAILNLVLMLRPSTPGANRFGPDPARPAFHPPAGSHGPLAPYGSAPWPPPPAVPGGADAPPTAGP